MPFALPWWLSAIVVFVARYLNERSARLRAEQGLKDLGAAVQRNESKAEAERQEVVAQRAAKAAVDGEDDPRDLRD